MTYTKFTKGLCILLSICMLAVMLPAFLSFAATTPGPYDESFVADPDTAYNEKLSASDNLALGATVNSLYGGHTDDNWGWHIEDLTDGSTNYLYAQDGDRWQVGNGGYHSYPHTPYGNSGLAAINHEEWITVDMGALKTFTTVELYPCRDSDGVCHAFPNTFDIDVSVDGTNWLTVAHVGDVKYEAGEFAPTVVQFDEVTAQYVRVNVFSMSKDINGKFYTKLSELAVFNRARDAAYCPNYALDAELSHSDAHVGGAWLPSTISDGNRYNVNFDHSNQKDFGQYVGWHTSTTAPGTDPAWVAFKFKAAKKVDRVMVWPSTELYTEGGAQGLYLPTSFVIQTSTDGAEWTDVTTFSEMPATYQAITIDFDAVTTEYIRVYMPRNGAIKLSEIEVYDSTALILPEVDNTVIEERDVNLALGATPIYCGITPAAGWDPSYLNNGTLEDAGFTTNENPAFPYVGYRFEHKTKLNKIVLYSSISNDERDIGTWSGVPKCFTVDYTVDGLLWKTVTAVTNTTPPAGHEAVEIVFDEIVAKEIRITASELYPKGSDSNKGYIQVSEMEVWYTDAEAELSAGDPISAYLQTRAVKDNEGNLVDGYSDLRIVLVGDFEALKAAVPLTVTVSFELDGVEVWSFSKQLGGANNAYTLYDSITADGETYTAADGAVIFGNIVTDIPDGAYSDITLTVADSADDTNILYYGTTN